MDNKTRYRRRLKLQAALTRVMELLATNLGDGIPPNRTTALMMRLVVAKLVPYAKAAGLNLADFVPDKPDLSRFVHLKGTRQTQTHKRYRRGW